MPLPFRQRIFVILVALTAVPTALAVVGWALAVRTVAPSAGARVALEEMTASARLMVDRMDTTHLSVRERAAFREHLEQLSNSVTLARRAETYLRYYAGGFAAVVFVLGAFAVIAAVRVAGHLSRQLSRPIDELVGWTRLIRRRMPLPAGPPTRGAPEFEALRQALRELATALDAAGERALGAVEPARARRRAAAGVRDSAARRRGGDGGARADRDRGEPGRGRPGGDDRRSWGRDPGRPAPARVRAVLHDQTRRDRFGTRPRAADDRGP